MPQVQFVGSTNKAKVTVPDIQAGTSVIHVVDDVLMPAGLGHVKVKKQG